MVLRRPRGCTACARGGAAGFGASFALTGVCGADCITSLEMSLFGVRSAGCLPTHTLPSPTSGGALSVHRRDPGPGPLRKVRVVRVVHAQC